MYVIIFAVEIKQRDMKKAIVIIRTSTKRQEIEAQRAETVAYAKSFGYSEDEIVVIGKQGASAIKIDEAYKKNLQLFYTTVESTPTIEKVFAWSLDRIARDEEVFAGFKKYLVKKKINLIIKNPTLFLLNEDGTVNNGMEIAINLFCTMAKQEMEIKADRFMRAKKYISAQGKFIGARYMMYGYTTDENGYLVINEEEASIIREIFKTYTTTKTSIKKIAIELNERGIRFRGRKFNEGHVCNILKNTAYIGYLERNKLVTKYPAIITEEDFKKSKETRDKRNNCLDKSVKHNNNLALKVLKCWECGGNYMYVEAGNKDKKDYKYVCYNRHKKYRLNPENVCLDSCAVQKRYMDTVLSDLAFTLKAEDSGKVNETKKKELEERKVILKQKIDNITWELSQFEERFGRAFDAYDNEVLTKNQYEKKIAKLKADKENFAISLSEYKKEIEDIDKYLNSKTEFSNLEENIFGSLKDEKYIKKVIDKYIKVAYAKAITCNGTNLTIYMLVDFDNNIYNYVYHQKHNVREGLYTLVNDRLECYVYTDLRDTVMSNAISDINNTSIPELKEKIEALNKELLTKLQT